ncbi:hypothetical protein GBP13_04715 [Pediococcus acidilactici]|uniref:hypothetical protein n=1 Tax=Pediococcus acidilactici TaxID=1254 RepID=UPI00132B776D|nr:hypothetical protein [Pediococcus acidilactici]KAF0364463.1 hypothetical protein GBO50_04710 [Pediococcus acidilactici]KAF0368540.1 hypothetical protein GBO55_05410 [Pediococcus acidilactici]KAF0420233.1 hypothetical protein GBO80_01835 [Pediococcus acidilactici]KAF0424419.1 hypothetical protein GBO82_01835 [Pediococcus acidilactici]KAF0474513.1 hypothetical protein GBP08_04715 [Pediococcus acidilactici]
MNKREVEELICDKLWIWRVWNTVNTNYNIRPAGIYLGAGAEQGFSFAALTFTRNGKINFPTKIGFVPPEFIYWNFDEKSQRIEFLDKERTPEIFASLPKVGIYGARQIDFADGNGLLVNFFDYGVEANVAVTQRGFFVMRSKCEIGQQRVLSRMGYNTYLMNDSDTLMDFLNQVYESLINHPELEEVVISRTGKLEVEFPPRIDQLLFANYEQGFLFDYCAGRRGIVLELLIKVLSVNNLRQLNPDDQRSETEVAEQIVSERFSDRCLFK